MTYDPIMIDALISDAREDMHRNASSWRSTDRVRVNSLLDALQSARDEILRLNKLLSGHCPRCHEEVIDDVCGCPETQ